LSLHRAVGNLIRNAQVYGVGPEVNVGIDSGGGHAVVSVADRGPDIDEGDAERLLKPFQHGDALRSRATGSAGLGLTLARDTARAHGGGLTLCNREGGGTIARLTVRI
jgi:two-component system OmpR family sensor kinase